MSRLSLLVSYDELILFTAPGNGTQMKIWQCFSGLAAQNWFLTDDNRIALQGQGRSCDFLVQNPLTIDSQDNALMTRTVTMMTGLRCRFGRAPTTMSTRSGPSLNDLAEETQRDS